MYGAAILGGLPMWSIHVLGRLPRDRKVSVWKASMIAGCVVAKLSQGFTMFWPRGAINLVFV